VRYRILLVDDDPLLVEAAAILLELDGHECRMASDGKLALELARSFAPAIVILDLGLPGMTGFELARALRVQAGDKRLHIATVTGRDDPDDLDRERAAGIDQHVTKPIDEAALKSIVLAAERAGVTP
jgi:DNA-binding response OmpR family regulator